MARARRNCGEQSPIELWQSSLVYVDDRCAGFDAVVLSEVIEHVEIDRLGVVAAVVFDAMAPRAVVVTTPNREFNARYDGIAPGAFRHRDHRFEFDRDEFAAWCRDVAAQYGYRVGFHPVGDVDPEVGSATQLAVFVRVDDEGDR